MTLADKITGSRLVFTPVFFLVYHLAGGAWTVPVLWALFIATEVSDLLDGKIARKRGESTDFGKLLDPFADTLARLTYFFLFTLDGILNPILFIVVIWREFGILFLRNLMLKKGIAMGARWGGKIKAVSYMVTGVLALFASSMMRLTAVAGLSTDSLLGYYRIFRIASEAVFAASVILALISFADYIKVYRRSGKDNG